MPKQPPPTPLDPFAKLAWARNLNNPTDQQLAPLRNHRNMFVVKETIHHGDVFIQRHMEVPRLNAMIAGALIMSSPYNYGDWFAGPDSSSVRSEKLHTLVDDLRNFRPNRSIGWSTFILYLGAES